MKVCHISSAHPIDDVRIYHKECSSLIEYGFDVELLGVLDAKVKTPQIKLHKFSNLKLNLLKRFFVLPRKIYKKAKRINADLYHFHDPELLVPMYFLKLKGKTIIYDVHEDVPRAIMGREWTTKFIRRIIASIFQIIENETSRKFDAIIAATPVIAKRFNGINKNTITVNNYPQLKEMNLIVTSKNKAEKICFSGIINEPRGIRYIIEALSNVDIKFKIIGDFSSESFRSELETLEGWKNVEYLGFLSRSEMFRELSECIAGVVTFLPLPNHINAQPNKMFEYMAAGIPVIASDFPLWREIIDSNKCGLCVNPKDLKDIATAIEFLKSNPEEVKKMGENGRKALVEKYNWENEAQKLITLYKEIEQKISKD